MIYSDDGKGMSLRWDPIDDRRYAHRWEDSSGSEQRMVQGAYRLAIEAFAQFTCLPGIQRISTVGFHAAGRGVAVVWPIWKPSLSVDVIRSLMTHPSLNRLIDQEGGSSRKQAAEMLKQSGVAAVILFAAHQADGLCQLHAGSKSVVEIGPRA